MGQHTAARLYNGPMFLDISRPVHPGIPVWPGDTPYALESHDWGSVRVGAATMSLHTGTHADAPSHFDPAGHDIAALSLETFLGPAQVIDVAGHDPIEPQHLGIPVAPRVLLRTNAWPVGTPFPETVPVLSRAAIDHLAANGVVLVGLDVPSVDAIDSRDLPNHHQLAASGIAILESLDLTRATPGKHQLAALPLRLAGGDASPVRAVLFAAPETETP